MPAARAMALRHARGPNPLWFAVQAPTNLGTISAPFLALSQDGFVVYQPLTTRNCTTGANRTLAPLGLWTLDFGLRPGTRKSKPGTSQNLRSHPHLSEPIRNFRFFWSACGVPNQTGSRQIKVNQGH